MNNCFCFLLPHHPIHLPHHPLRLIQGDDDALVVEDVIEGEGAGFASYFQIATIAVFGGNAGFVELIECGYVIGDGHFENNFTLQS